MTVDDVITKITEAPNDSMAKAIMRSVPHKLILQVADQLHIETEGHGDGWLRTEIVREARA